MVPFLGIFLDLGTSKKQLSWRREKAPCCLGLVGSVQLRDVMDICVMAIKCMGQAAVCVAVCSCEEWLQVLYFSSVMSDELCPGMGLCCHLALPALQIVVALLLASLFFWQPSCFQRDSSGHSYSNVFVWFKWLVLSHHMYVFSGPGIWLWHRKSITFLA